jgi:hypothetical protein
MIFMKRLLLFTTALSFAFSAMADCAGEGLSVFPTGGKIMKNTLFLLEGYADSRSVIEGLNGKYPIYLESGGKKIRLVVKETHYGEFWVEQALLVPETEPEAGLTYTLVIDNLPEYQHLGDYDYKTEKDIPYSYTILDAKDTEMPVVSAAPKETGKSYATYGCGPAMYVNFDVPATDASPILVRTTVKNLLSGKETTYYLLAADKTIAIGHHMCSGPFIFNHDAGDNYEVAFSFMDGSGNTSPWEGPPIPFIRPKPQDGR